MPPIPRMVAGVASVVVGAGTSAMLWEAGWVWGLALFAVLAGLGLFVSGFLDLRRRIAFESLVTIVKAREPELVAGMVEAKRRGESPVRWLSSQGILDAEIRGYLLERVKASESRSGSSP